MSWTNPWGEHKYFDDIEMREDGGTPGILQSIRTSLCLNLKNKMGINHILKREKEQLSLLFSHLEKFPEVNILAGNIQDRIGIVSFHIETIHYNLIVRLLNDRYGIQVRGGCSCAGTYGHYLLNIDQTTSKQITEKIIHGDMSAKPGWVRFSIHPIMTDEEILTFIQAIREIIENIDEWKKGYVYDPVSNDYFYIHHLREDMSPFFRFK